MHFILHQRGILYLATAVDQFGLSSIQNCNGYIELIYFHLFYGNIMDVDLSNIKKWVIVYPIYINSKKTLAEGRRINASKACENPTCTEVYDCCAHLKIPRVIEADNEKDARHVYRDWKQLKLHVAELVRRHPGRTKKQEPATSAAVGSKYGKGGKKKRNSLFVCLCPTRFDPWERRKHLESLVRIISWDLDDIGGAFGMGAVGGAAFHFLKGTYNSPKGERLAGGSQEVRMNAPRVGGSFEVWGGLFSTFDCTMVYMRQEEDPWYSIIAGSLNKVMSAPQNLPPMEEPVPIVAGYPGKTPGRPSVSVGGLGEGSSLSSS
ncbi:hypothetical protein SASPL_150890 [Salvia splendens]|uniref:Uncharacterized protein n=1 Tax=Salvia splendens TaxID=180675 RepID=A0A8X8W6W2_SALSN|nr:hypothetical protein SASPL_150890 [Salvia splendens]